jgi:hypothetical protein
VHGRHSGRCGGSTTEREFPSDDLYRRDDRGIVRVESLIPQGLAFFVIHTVLDAAPCRAVPMREVSGRRNAISMSQAVSAAPNTPRHGPFPGRGVFALCQLCQGQMLRPR